MPRKLRELKADLRRAGFFDQPGKGSHVKWIHSVHHSIIVTLSGNDSDDAQRYQEKQIRSAIAKSRMPR